MNVRIMNTPTHRRSTAIMNFAEVFEPRYRYSFPDVPQFVSVRSIEYEYNRFQGIGDSPRCTSAFSAWLDSEQKMRYPTIIAVYDYVMINPRKMLLTSKERQDRIQHMLDTPIETKLTHLIHSDPTLGALFIHPMLAAMFAFSLNKGFAVDVAGHIHGLMTVGANVQESLFQKLRRDIQDRDALIANFQRTSNECDIEITSLREMIMTNNRELYSLRQKNDQLCAYIDEQNQSNRGVLSRLLDKVPRIFQCGAS